MGSADAEKLIADIRYVQLRAMSVGVQQKPCIYPELRNYVAAGENKTLPQDILVTGTSMGNTVAFNTIGNLRSAVWRYDYSLRPACPCATINIRA